MDQVLEGEAKVLHFASVQVQALDVEEQRRRQGRLEDFARDLDVFGVSEHALPRSSLLPVNLAEEGGS